MSGKSAIEWTDAETFAERFRGVEGHHFEQGFDLTLRPDKLTLPLRWRKPRRVFVNSMSDLFHKDVPDDYIARVFAVMASASRHTFQILTKRHARMRSLLTSETFREAVADAVEELWTDGQVRALPEEFDSGPWWPLPNVWLGVSVENQQWAATRIIQLLQTPAAVRWISAEPLLGPVDLRNLRARNGALIDCLGGDVKSSDGRDIYSCTPSILDWVVVGGESGPGARPMHPDWARTLRDQCRASGVPFLFKQWGAWGHGVGAGAHAVHGDGSHQPFREYMATDGGTPGDVAVMRRVGKKAAGRELDGRTWDEYPEPDLG